MAAQLEIVLLDGSQGGGGGSVSPSGTPPASAPPVPQSPTPQQTQPTQPQPAPAPAVETLPGRKVYPEPMPGADRTVADTMDLPSLDEVARILDEMSVGPNYRHENPEPRTERVQPQPARDAEPVDDATRGAVVKATDTVQEAIEEITGGVTRALERLEQLIREARGEASSQPDTTRRPTPTRDDAQARPGDSVGRAIGRNLMGRFGNRMRRTRVGRMAGRVARSRVGRAIGRRVGQGVARSRVGRAIGRRVGQGVAGRAAAGGVARGAMTTVAGAGARGAAAGAMGGLTTAGVAIGAVAVPVAAATAAAFVFAAALRKAGDVANNLGDQLEEFSGVILAQRSAAEMRMFTLQTDRAERIGPAVAQIEAAQARMSEAMYEVQTDIYEILAKLAPKIEMGFDLVAAGAKGIIAMKEGIDVLLNPLSAKEKQEFANASLDFTMSLTAAFADNAPAGRDQLLMQLFNQLPNQPPPVRPNRKPQQKPFVIRP